MESALDKNVLTNKILSTVFFLLLIGWVPSFSDNLHVGMMRISGMQGNGLLLMIATYILGRFTAARKSCICNCVCFRRWGILLMFVLVALSQYVV